MAPNVPEFSRFGYRLAYIWIQTRWFVYLSMQWISTFTFRSPLILLFHHALNPNHESSSALGYLLVDLTAERPVHANDLPLL